MIEFITPILIILGSGVYLCIALIALLESTPVIGTFAPGTLIILFCGFLVSEGYIDFVPTLVAVIVGLIVGDMLGYYFGMYGRSYIHEHKGLLRTAHIEMGRGFFTKHGGKSVLLGRFIGPIRSIIPVVAGMINMSLRKFVYFNVVSAFLWSFLYVYLGYAFGSHLKTIEQAISRTGIIITLIIIAGCVLTFHVRKRDTPHADF